MQARRRPEQEVEHDLDARAQQRTQRRSRQPRELGRGVAAAPRALRARRAMSRELRAQHLEVERLLRAVVVVAGGDVRRRRAAAMSRTVVPWKPRSANSVLAAATRRSLVSRRAGLATNRCLKQLFHRRKRVSVGDVQSPREPANQGVALAGFGSQTEDALAAVRHSSPASLDRIAQPRARPANVPPRMRRLAVLGTPDPTRDGDWACRIRRARRGGSTGTGGCLVVSGAYASPLACQRPVVVSTPYRTAAGP